MPFHGGEAVDDFYAEDSGDILGVMQRAGCRHADIYRDGDYLLSARLDDAEVWSIYYSRDLSSLPVPPDAGQA